MIHTVLLAQNCQQLHGCHNPDELPSLSVSAESCNGALLRGNSQELAMLNVDQK